jgi:hypothetical protein
MIEARTAHAWVLKGNNGGIWAQKGKDDAGLSGHGGPPFQIVVLVSLSKLS